MHIVLCWWLLFRFDSPYYVPPKTIESIIIGCFLYYLLPYLSFASSFLLSLCMLSARTLSARSIFFSQKKKQHLPWLEQQPQTAYQVDITLLIIEKQNKARYCRCRAKVVQISSSIYSPLPGWEPGGANWRWWKTTITISVWMNCLSRDPLDWFAPIRPPRRRRRPRGKRNLSSLS